MSQKGKTPKIAFKPGDVDCGINIFCQIVGTMVGVIGAMQGALAGPWKQHSTDEAEIAAMSQLAHDIVFKHVVAGMSITMIFGTFYYTWMGYRMMKNEQRSDVCVLPYGVNTPAAFAFVFQVVGKAATTAHHEGMDWEAGMWYAWRAGCVANLVAGLIGAVAGFFGPMMVRVAPKTALLIALAGIGFTWLGIGQLVECFSTGYAGLLPLAASLVLFFSKVRFPGAPVAVLIAAIGALVGWISMQGWAEGSGGSGHALKVASESLGFYFPIFLDGDSFAAIPKVIGANLAVILPVALTGAVNTLLSTYAAHDAGDLYNIKETMIVDGLTTVVAGLFGSPLGTCVYIGHPQFKAKGGGFYYGFINMVLFVVLAQSGLFALVSALIPPYAIAAIILFVGLAINEDAFSLTPQSQYPAAILGLMPPMADWVCSKWPHGPSPPAGLAALSHGALLTGVLWTAIAVLAIQMQFKQATIWSVISAVLAAFGLIHQPVVDVTFKTFTGKDGEFDTSACSYTIGYVLVALLFSILGVMQYMKCSCVPKESDMEENQGTEEELGMEMSHVRSLNAMAQLNVGTPFHDDEETEASGASESEDA
mmetsp:Transcript_42163/g.75739  ORF Transcript_42163/g.75739 Transcript_42163/m.75739 type:complete len:592 (+) Transcript_42163:51-1826(+)|eukprot:CAMPEP_0197703804 /NCGR_PEP_ID=MMETSP1338-20131121/125621_1 /TAXON_ID=43686 ORGANISM="Pelagodinium beii, Strain RCC1491" /NCGR_SAMPLE_ID=MMETSP1338 /ASSEMBLY_ACC=CAM_ASM_000754 /LENGTH=591 /DNA_ID=CAMNT_0043287703 /DNA_START=51 /DNA_END=1826 /DNA_ORIENTATION=+